MKTYILKYYIVLIPTTDLRKRPILYSITLKVWEKIEAESVEEARKYAKKRAAKPEKIINDCELEDCHTIFSINFRAEEAKEKVPQTK